ncbi:OLC1v1024430C1 [Oldenlandia corymbosa var. corymbosa]|uniref:OLC1v1024430C1 n=1 Tax=Oldenlandia corymbosa var. corymbosa TaxID=529605 RepID=A0AAV1C2T1_OLDCO|nr:OLC1v1024430C1 [Oldenlandia corymbosa var. corymbosa]
MVNKRRKEKPLNNTANVDSRPDGGSEKVNRENSDGRSEKRSFGKVIRVQQEEELERLVAEIEASSSTKQTKDLGKVNLQTLEERVGDSNVDSRPDGGSEKVNRENSDGRSEKRSFGKVIRVQQEEELERIKRKFETVKPTTPSTEWRRIEKGKEAVEVSGIKNIGIGQEDGIQIVKSKGQLVGVTSKQLNTKGIGSQVEEVPPGNRATLSATYTQEAVVRILQSEDLENAVKTSGIVGIFSIGARCELGILLDPGPNSSV